MDHGHPGNRADSCGLLIALSAAFAGKRCLPFLPQDPYSDSYRGPLEARFSEIELEKHECLPENSIDSYRRGS